MPIAILYYYDPLCSIRHSNISVMGLSNEQGSNSHVMSISVHRLFICSIKLNANLPLKVCIPTNIDLLSGV
jgi:hypothetical protein